MIFGGVGLLTGTVVTALFDDGAEEARLRALQLEEIHRQNQLRQAQQHTLARIQALERALQNPHLDPWVRLQIMAQLSQLRGG